MTDFFKSRLTSFSHIWQEVKHRHLDNLRLDPKNGKTNTFGQGDVETQKCLELGGLLFVRFFVGMKLWSMNQAILYSDHLASHENHRDFQFGDLWLFLF